MSVPRTLDWVGGVDGHIRMIDQTLLPEELKEIECRDVATVWEAIKALRVRGAPAIGVSAAMGVVLGLQETDSDEAAFYKKLDEVSDYLASSRPTAVNLFWALKRMKRVAESMRGQPIQAVRERLLAEAQTIRQEDAAMCRAIGEAGEPLIADGSGVLTHCNAGGLATAEYGTALAPMYVAHERGKRFSVYADETRPLLQGARLTSWELQQVGIDVTVLCDNMAACVMASGKIDLVITGADRIAGNGDTANKVGTYGVALLAKAHGIPFYVAAPSSTFDLEISNGAEIPIEHRDQEEVACGFGKRTVPEGVACYNQAFDVTPVELIAGFITEKGLLKTGSGQKIADFLA